MVSMSWQFTNNLHKLKKDYFIFIIDVNFNNYLGLIMKLELFTNSLELEEYLRVATLSVIFDSEEVHISKKFREEITTALKYTQSLPKNFQFKYSPWVLYAFRNEQNEIVGTVVVGQESHMDKAGQLEYVAIRRDQQRKGYGKCLIKTIIDEIKLHSKYKCVTLSTNKKNVGFYEKCGLTLAGKLKFNKTYRYFLTKTI